MGESEAIILADSEHAKVLLMDEAHGRFVAQQMHIPITDVIGVLAAAYKKGFLSADEIKKSVQIMKISNRFISERLYNIKKILKMLEQGKAVNVLDLGTIYIAMKCNAKGKSEVSESGNFYIKFAPTELANKALASLSVDKIVFTDCHPEITAVADLSPDNDDGNLSSGKPCRINGGHLKIGGTESGIWFAPVDSGGKVSDDESSWIKVDDSALFRNKPSELNFFVPETVSAGNYKIILRTSYLAKNRSRKTLLETRSETVAVSA